ncbi:MAG: hypothetical protein A2V45_00070 [Candidatus Aminicenantes bacterium RBG_19FT_COMBO_58_17]|jgi:uncharacterized membrane-anchored protein YhcB (DUF1043 family)|nr:MAG: hypothetical protein A2V45_00070 [Candidatus Aminicenantes bacterium RBG_19FT_COMBO_58_17]HCS48472.1 hypothetical protein [Candidatus Aminicenantes bacterium]
MPVTAMKTLFSRAFLTGLAVGLLTARLSDYKIKKKNKLQNLGLTPESLRKTSGHRKLCWDKGET